MKRIIFLLSAAFLYIGCVSTPVTRTVSVTVGAFGYSEDRINVVVEKRSADMNKAQAGCDEIFKSVKELLEGKGLLEDDYNLSENSSYRDQDNDSESSKYIARKAFDIRVTDNIDAESLMSELRDSGATGVYRNVYDRSSEEKAPSDFESALKEAEKRAGNITDKLGLSLGDVVSIDEMNYGIEDSRVYNIKFEMK